MNEHVATSNTLNNINLLKAPKWFWWVTALALLWFFMDLTAFIMRVFMLEGMIGDMPEGQKNLYLQMPAWVNILFSFEVFGGLLGGVFLVLKKRWALMLFIISLMGTLSQTFYIYFMSEAIALMGPPAIVMPIVAILITLGLILLSRSAISKGWVA